jgi:hypothetical protein
MQQCGSYVDQSDGHSETGRNIHQRAAGLIGPNDLLLQQPHYPQQHPGFDNQDNGHLAMQTDNPHMFVSFADQHNNNQDMGFQQPQSAAPSRIDSTIGYPQEHEILDSSYQSAGFGGLSGKPPAYEQTVELSSTETPPVYKVYSVMQSFRYYQLLISGRMSGDVALPISTLKLVQSTVNLWSPFSQARINESECCCEDRGSMQAYRCSTTIPQYSNKPKLQLSFIAFRFLCSRISFQPALKRYYPTQILPFETLS